MATPNEMAKAVADAPKPKSLHAIIESSIKELGKALPAHLNAERIARIALTCIRLTPKLAECTPESFMGSLFVAAQLGLEPVGGRAYLIPFKKNYKEGNDWKSKTECQFVIGYKGLADLFYRHEKAVELSWGVVHEKDAFSYEYGTDSFLKHVPALADRGNVVGYYVVAKLTGGGRPFMFMPHAEAMAHGQKHSKTWLTKAYNTKTRRMEDCEPHFDPASPWAKTPDAMCLKTVLIQLAKLLPLSIELQRAIQADETSRDFRAGIDDALDLPPKPFEDAEPVDTTAAPAAAKAPAADAPGDAQEPAMCVVCKKVAVDVAGGYDTCPSCARSV